MTRAPNLVIVSDDIPARFLAEMLFNPGAVEAVFSEEDAVLADEAENLRSPHPHHGRYWQQRPSRTTRLSPQRTPGLNVQRSAP